MSPARSTWLAAAGITAAAAVCLVGAGVGIWAASADAQSIGVAVTGAGFMVAFAAVGVVVAAARPSNAVGWVMLGGAALSALGNGGASLAHHGIVSAPGSVPVPSAFAVGGQACRSLGWYVLTLALPMIFPEGSLPRPGWRWLRRLLSAVLVACVVGPLTDKQADLTGLGGWHNPIAPGGAAPVLSGISFLVQVPLGVVTAGGVVALLVSRWRRGDALVRQQLTLVVVAAAIPVVAGPIVIASNFTNGAWVFGLTVIPLPFAIGFAVLARGLYDLRTAANRTLAWVTLSAVVAGVYALAIAGLGNQMGVRHATWLPWVAAGVVAVSFAPLRDGLQRAVNRLTFGRWDEPYDVLAALGQRVEATADADRLLDDVITELRGLGLREVGITDTDGRVVAGDIGAHRDDVVVPLSAYGSAVGALRYRPPATPLRPRDRRLLDDLAGHLGGVLHAQRLTADLQAARERLVLAREEERRRLRRDLHDGLGPALAGHVLRLDILARKVTGDATASGEVEALRDELRGTVLEVRRVVEGLRPPALDELGLHAALVQATQRLTAGSGVTVDVEVGELPVLPAAVEVAAYRIVTEAVTNVVRHSAASACRVRVTARHGALRVEVADDGRGVGDGRPVVGGNGLQTMRERAEELRGRLQVTSDAAGTRVVAELPLPPSPRQPSARKSVPVA